MDNIIERYLYDVTRRLPEKDRDEVRRELQSNIYDMLPDNADDEAIRIVLQELGAPSVLAQKYSQKPRYLISPAVYDEYIRVLKWVTPLAGVIALVIGGIVGIFSTLNDGIADMSYLFNNTISQAISIGASVAFQALIWTTIGFVIAERAGAFPGEGAAWKVEELPELPPDKKSVIPLSDSITELVFTILFSIAAVLFCTGRSPFVWVIQTGDIQVQHPFSQSFLSTCVPAVIAMAFFGICECVVKIWKRYWTPVVCAAVVISNIANMGIVLYLVRRPNILSAEFLSFLENTEWGNLAFLRFMGERVDFPVALIISAVVAVCCLIGCIVAVCKTIAAARRAA